MRSILRSLEIPSEIRQGIEAQFEDPLTLFRIFHYPPHSDIFGNKSTAVGKHSDYGASLLCIYSQSLGPTAVIVSDVCLSCQVI